MILNLKKGDTVLYCRWNGSKKKIAKSQILLTFDDFALLKNGDRVIISDIVGKQEKRP